ncbi:DUF2892 domain-containing protein [Paracoccus sp. M683]|uniref:YgaP family membrane protein n=1 Tax=Paracoccus sp. M683 TaxID=2594268 RepID=UPI00117CDE52|nr:DUF2892 domain-containing protein [Paracoccus sp. M683]TRW99335.1 DUF2892 domain-containing protein [Paracoccus sp. M683]
MTPNMGNLDRVLRATIGIVLLVLAFGGGSLAAGWLHWTAIVVAIILLGTAAFGSCPVYTILGIRTCHR